MTIVLYDLAGADDALRLSPYCWCVRMALKHKGLPFTTVPWRFVDKDAIAFSGQRLVPVIVDGERTVSDSWNIARYLEAAYPDSPSLFGGPAGEAATLFIKNWYAQSVHLVALPVVVLDLFASLHDKDKTYFRASREARFGRRLEDFAAPNAEGIAALRTALAPLGTTLERQPYLGGASPLFADYVVFGGFMWARAVSQIKLIETDDPIYAWRERLLDAFEGHARSMPGNPV